MGELETFILYVTEHAFPLNFNIKKLLFNVALELYSRRR